MQQIPTDGISDRLTDVRALRVRPETVAQEFPIRFHAALKVTVRVAARRPQKEEGICSSRDLIN